jgi:hypothetical protein
MIAKFDISPKLAFDCIFLMFGGTKNIKESRRLKLLFPVERQLGYGDIIEEGFVVHI